MTSDRIRKLALSLAPDPIIKDDKVVFDGRVLFDQPTDVEMQRALNQWDKGKSEPHTNKDRMEDLQGHPEYDELGGLSQSMAEDREV